MEQGNLLLVFTPACWVLINPCLNFSSISIDYRVQEARSVTPCVSWIIGLTWVHLAIPGDISYYYQHGWQSQRTIISLSRPWVSHAWTPFHPKQSSWWESHRQLPWFLPAVFRSCQCSGVACILLSLYINISSCCKWHSFLFQFPIILCEYIEIQLILGYEFRILWHC